MTGYMWCSKVCEVRKYAKSEKYARFKSMRRQDIHDVRKYVISNWIKVYNNTLLIILHCISNIIQCSKICEV